MADPSRRLPSWLDPLGIRGSILDPFALFADAARMVVPPGESIAWMMTTAARRLQGRRFKTHGEPLIEATVSKVREVVPAMTVSVPGLSRPISIWDRAAFSLESVMVDGHPVTGADVVATGIGVSDPTAQTLSVAHVDITLTLNANELRPWFEDAGVHADLDMRTGIAEVRPWARAGWIQVMVEPIIVGGRACGRPTAVKAGPIRVPLPGGLSRSRSRRFPAAHDSLAVTEVRFRDGIHAEISLGGDDINIGIDIPRVVAEIGLEGPRSVARILTL